MNFKNPIAFPLLVSCTALLVFGVYFIFTNKYIKSNTLVTKNRVVSNIETIEILSERYMFSPTLIPLKKGKTIRLILTTVDVQHGISLPELNINLSAYPGKPAETIITPEKIGEFTTNCSLYCGTDHNKMKLTFQVRE